MLCNRLLLTFVYSVLFTTLSVFAAKNDSCFNLMDYSPPAIKYHLLNLFPDFYFWGSRYDETNRNFSNNDSLAPVIIKEHSGKSSIEPDLRLNSIYEYYHWNGRTEWRIEGDLSLNGRLSNDRPDADETDENETVFKQDNRYVGYADGDILLSMAYYFRWPFFIGAEINPKIIGSCEYQERVFKYFDPFEEPTSQGGWYSYRNDQYRRTDYTIGGDINLRAGAGRIEDVSFAVAALNMFDRIAAVEQSYHGCTAQQIQDFAALIEKMRNRRIFDARIGRMENIETLCSFLKEQGIVDALSPRSVLELIDQWEYTFHQKRSKGFTLALYPEINYSNILNWYSSIYGNCSDYRTTSVHIRKNNEVDITTCDLTSDEYYGGNRVHLLTYGINLSGRYERPLSRYLQLSLLGEAVAELERQWGSYWTSFEQSEDEADDCSFILPRITATESASFSYYPNTRTSLTITEAIRYRRMFSYDAIKRNGTDFDLLPIDNHDDRSLLVSLDGSCTYYISPRLEIGLNAGLSLEDSYHAEYGYPPWDRRSYKSRSTTDFDYSIGASMKWRIF